MGRRHLLYLLYTSSVRPPAASTPNFISPPPFLLTHKGYSQETSSKGSHGDETMIHHDRAPSTLEEFKRLEEDKANQGVVSQTVDKAESGAVEAVTGDDSFESVKERFKEDGGNGDFRRTGEK